MTSIFQPSLLNDPLGDPGLLVQLSGEKGALLFDLGDLSRIPNKVLMKTTHVFISHTHIDHFIGFDRLLRIIFGRGEVLKLYGPENIIRNVEGKLAGFTWNLVDKYDEAISIEVTEVHPDGLKRAVFRAKDKFERCELEDAPFVEGQIVEESSFTVSVAILEHRVPCLGFALCEKPKVKINKERLDSLGARPGSWLNDLKEAALAGRDDAVVDFPGRSEEPPVTVGQLRDDLYSIVDGQKIVYVTDTVFSESNNPNIIQLAQDADLFFCESPFTAEETDRALDRRHLTAQQAGTLARAAQVKQLRIFHFSQRHARGFEILYQEAAEAYGAPVPLSHAPDF
ncbi:MAG: ribonuclease Z [Candidatus Nitrohelix vancouverensis]|uniref:Ribonuclease Z n=1 Tax=Candidatus Nitrohelix vancouverensis TaxID=2705534 RepID=A0A7T0G394_9BACT|nr:MAG: ribonuclease Z [Candidatus Nitrohelix vancouverensis]